MKRATGNLAHLMPFIRSFPLSRCFTGQGQKPGESDEQGDLLSLWGEPLWLEGSLRDVGRRDRRCEVLDADHHGVEESRSCGHLHRVRGWIERLSRSHRSRISTNAGAALHGASGQTLALLRLAQRSQSGGRWLEASLSGSDLGRG